VCQGISPWRWQNFCRNVETTSTKGVVKYLHCWGNSLRIQQRVCEFLQEVVRKYVYITVQPHLSGLTGTACRPDTQKIGIIRLSFENKLHWQREVEKKVLQTAALGYIFIWVQIKQCIIPFTVRLQLYCCPTNFTHRLRHNWGMPVVSWEDLLFSLLMSVFYHVSSAIVSQQFPQREHLQMCGRQDFTPAFETHITAQHQVMIVYGLFPKSI